MKIEEMENILAKKATGEATSAELIFLDQWRNESAENQAIYNEYSILWDMSANYIPENFSPNFESALSSHLTKIEKETVVTSISNKKAKIKSLEPRRRAQMFSIKNISSLAAVFVIGIAAMFLMNNRTTTISAENGVRFASLEDGSNIWLDKGSSIEYKNGFGTSHRNIELAGKVFFDVKRNENLPFRITDNEINVTVLGTSFTVDGDNDIVSVSSGKVSVENQTENIVLVENQEARLLNDQFNTTTIVTNTAIWRNETLSFDNAPITQVVADINLFHNNMIELENNSKFLDCSFTSGGLAEESLDNILKILEESFNLEVSNNLDGKIRLNISDCN